MAENDGGHLPLRHGRACPLRRQLSEVRRPVIPTVSWPGLARPSTTGSAVAAKAWMAGTRPAMTREEPVPLSQRTWGVSRPSALRRRGADGRDTPAMTIGRRPCAARPLAPARPHFHG